MQIDKLAQPVRPRHMDTTHTAAFSAETLVWRQCIDLNYVVKQDDSTMRMHRKLRDSKDGQACSAKGWRCIIGWKGCGKIYITSAIGTISD